MGLVRQWVWCQGPIVPSLSATGHRATARCPGMMNPEKAAGHQLARIETGEFVCGHHEGNLPCWLYQLLENPPAKKHGVACVGCATCWIQGVFPFSSDERCRYRKSGIIQNPLLSSKGCGLRWLTKIDPQNWICQCGWQEWPARCDARWSLKSDSEPASLLGTLHLLRVRAYDFQPKAPSVYIQLDNHDPGHGTTSVMYICIFRVKKGAGYPSSLCDVEAIHNVFENCGRFHDLVIRSFLCVASVNATNIFCSSWTPEMIMFHPF